MKTILLISPYWKEPHRWMVSSYKLAELWQRNGYRVVVVCMSSESGIDEVSDTLTVHRYQDVFLRDPWNYGIAFGFSGYVSRLVKALQPDHIVVNKILFWSSIALLWLRLRGHRVSLLTDTLVGITWWPRGTLPSVCAAIYANTLGWLIMLAASRIVTFHPQPQAILRRLLVAGKTQVIPTGIDVEGYQVRKFTGSQVSSKEPENQRTSEPITVTYVGRIESVKGVDDLLAAAVPLKDECDLHIQVVGWYKDDHPLVEQYQRDVHFTGLRDDIPDILAETDIFVLPSHSEGLSNALMEAMASSCACVATDVGGNRYLIENSVSGFLYPPGDREALQSHLRRLVSDAAKREQLQVGARKRIEAQFSWSKLGERYQKFFATAS